MELAADSAARHLVPAHQGMEQPRGVLTVSIESDANGHMAEGVVDGTKTVVLSPALVSKHGVVGVRPNADRCDVQMVAEDEVHGHGGGRVVGLSLVDEVDLDAHCAGDEVEVLVCQRHERVVGGTDGLVIRVGHHLLVGLGNSDPLLVVGGHKRPHDILGEVRAALLDGPVQLVRGLVALAGIADPPVSFLGRLVAERPGELLERGVRGRRCDCTGVARADRAAVALVTAVFEYRSDIGGHFGAAPRYGLLDVYAVRC